MSPGATTLVVGGTKGIGLACALRLASPGSTVIVSGSTDRGAGELARQRIAATGADAHVVMADMGEPDGVASLIAAVRRRTDRLDHVVHAAVRPLSGPLLEADPDEVEHALRVGGTSLLALVRGALPLLHAGASVVYLSSLGSQRVVPGYGAIGVAKATAECLVRYLAAELAPRAVRVNTVSSGPLGTDAYRSVFPDADERLAAAAERSPAHRPQTVDDVAEVVALLCSAGAELVQGQHLRVDGGLYL